MTDVRYAVAPITSVDVRDPSSTDDNTWTMSGIAAVFNTPTVLYDGKFMRIEETIDERAFDVVMRNQPMTAPEGVVHYNFGHDMNRAVAATDVPAGQPGNLTLGTNGGLAYLAKVPRDDPDGVALAVKMRSGVVRQASFAFTIKRMESVETEGEDGRTEYRDTILEIGHLYDVCACAQGAYPQTVSGLRSYAAAIGQPPDEGGGHPRQPPGGAIPVSPETGGRVDITPPVAVEWPDLREQVARFRPIR
jgi:phage head maturation protease